METFIQAIYFLLLSGFSYLTYNHPVKIREFLKLLLLGTIIFFVISFMYFDFIKNNYREVQGVANVDNSLSIKNLNIDSIYKKTTDKDSIDNYIKDYQDNLKLEYAMYNAKHTILKTVRTNINTLIENNDKRQDITLLYCVVFCGTVIVFYTLSFVIEYLKKVEIDKENNTE